MVMDIDKFTSLFEILIAAYPGHKFKDEDDMGRTLVVWYTMLNDLPYELLEAAIQKHILQSNSPFFPSINEIRTKALEILSPESITAAEAWGEVLRAVQNYGMYNMEEGLKSLKPLTRKVAEAVGFRTICIASEDEIGVVRGQFLKMYEQMANRQRQEALLPEGMKKKLQELTEGKGLKMIGG
jgi:hypothetical protein